MLKLIYGSGTRSVRVMNLVIAVVGLLLQLLYVSNITTVHLPTSDKGFSVPVIVIVVANILFCVLSFAITDLYRRRLFKVMSLLLGALHQACVATFYVSDYPPFEPMVLVSLTFVVWFSGAAYYVMKVEGLYGDS